MTTNFGKIKESMCCFYKALWLLLAFIIVSVGAAGCVSPRSVRLHDEEQSSFMKIDTSEDKAQNTSENNKEIDEIRKFEQLLLSKNAANQENAKAIAGEAPTSENIKNSTIDPNQINLSERKIPTLREQMQQLVQDQEEMKSGISEIRDDVEEIKEALSAIKRKIEAAEKFSPVNKEEKKDNNQQDYKIAKTANKKYSLKADETVNLSPQKKKTAPKPKTKIKSNEDKSNSEEIISSFFKDGTDSYEKGDYSAAIKSFEKVLDSQKDSEISKEAAYYLAESYFKQKQYENAEKYFEELTGESNFNPESAHIMLAESKVMQGKVEEAKVEYEALIKKFPKSEHVPKARKMLQQL